MLYILYKERISEYLLYILYNCACRLTRRACKWQAGRQGKANKENVQVGGKQVGLTRSMFK